MLPRKLADATATSRRRASGVGGCNECLGTYVVHYALATMFADAFAGLDLKLGVLDL